MKKPSKQNEAENNALYERMTSDYKCPSKKKKKIKNCKCQGCKEFMKNSPENSKHPSKEKERTQLRLTSVSNTVRLLMLGVLLFGLGYAAYYLNSLSSQKIPKQDPPGMKKNLPSEFPRTGYSEETIRALLQRQNLQLDVSREDIAKKLPELLKDFGRVYSSPENYDPKKSNVYLIAQRHFASMKDSDQETFDHQANILRIGHILHALGVQTQLLEGIGDSIDLTHNKHFPKLSEDPLRSIPQYFQNGQVRRAYIALEGIYQDELQSIGTEDMLNGIKSQKERKYADKALFPQAQIQIVVALAKCFNIDIGRPRSLSESEIKHYVSLIREKTKNMSARQIEALKNTFVLSNPTYQKFLKLFSRDEYYKYAVRDKQFTKAIENSNNDIWMIIGAAHIKGIMRLLKENNNEKNVFIISPEGLGDNTSLEKDPGSLSIEKHKQNLIRYDLYLLGLEQTKQKRY